MRKLILALSISVLFGSDYSCAQTLYYLGGQKLHLLKLLPPPPPPNSEAAKRDLVEVLEVQENRTPERAERGRPVVAESWRTYSSGVTTVRPS